MVQQGHDAAGGHGTEVDLSDIELTATVNRGEARQGRSFGEESGAEVRFPGRDGARVPHLPSEMHDSANPVFTTPSKLPSLGDQNHFRTPGSQGSHEEEDLVNTPLLSAVQPDSPTDAGSRPSPLHVHFLESLLTPVAYTHAHSQVDPDEEVTLDVEWKVENVPADEAAQRLAFHDNLECAAADEISALDCDATARQPPQGADFQAPWPSAWARARHAFSWLPDALLIAALVAVNVAPRGEARGVWHVCRDWSGVLWAALLGRALLNTLHFTLSLALLPAQLLFCEGPLRTLLSKTLREANDAARENRERGRALLARRGESVRIRAPDGAELDGMYFRAPGAPPPPLPPVLTGHASSLPRTSRTRLVPPPPY